MKQNPNWESAPFEMMYYFPMDFPLRIFRRGNDVWFVSNYSGALKEIKDADALSRIRKLIGIKDENCS